MIVTFYNFTYIWSFFRTSSSIGKTLNFSTKKMHTNILKLIYTHSDLLQVSAKKYGRLQGEH
jgi:hypothetical protein